MKQKIFWRSALKASVLITLAFYTINFLTLLVSNSIPSTQSEISKLGPAVAAISLLLLIPLLQLAWVAFAFIEHRIPIQSLFAKVLIVNSLLTLVFSLVLKPVFVAQLLALDFDASFLTAFGLFLAETFSFWMLYRYFKKHEELQIAPKTGLLFGNRGKRIAAFIIDNVLVSIVSVLFLVIGTMLQMTLIQTDFNKLFFLLALANNTSWLLFIVLPMCGALYFTILEGKFKGSIGKQLFGLGVAQENGARIGLQTAFFRNCTKFTLLFTFVLLAEFLAMFVTQKRQRIADMVAQTVVIEKT